VEDEQTYIRMTRERWDGHELFDFGIFRASDQAYLGNVGVHSISWEHRRCELGYWLAGPYEGQGYMAEAVTALERMLFAMGFNRIEIRCSSANVRSSAVPRRLGYRLEGSLRQDCVEKGTYRDTWVFARIRSDLSQSLNLTKN
jgi:RimJ/RimL family protein N-acetyltransferase